MVEYFEFSECNKDGYVVKDIKDIVQRINGKASENGFVVNQIIQEENGYLVVYGVSRR